MILGQRAEAIRYLYQVEKLSVSRIAKMLNMTPGGVSNSLRRSGVESLHPKRPRTIVRTPAESRQAPDPNGSPRDPCTFCGVRAEVHAEFGCKRWVR